MKYTLEVVESKMDTLKNEMWQIAVADCHPTTAEVECLAICYTGWKALEKIRLHMLEDAASRECEVQAMVEEHKETYIHTDKVALTKTPSGVKRV